MKNIPGVLPKWLRGLYVDDPEPPMPVAERTALGLELERFLKTRSDRCAAVATSKPDDFDGPTEVYATKPQHIELASSCYLCGRGKRSVALFRHHTGITICEPCSDELREGRVKK